MCFNELYIDNNYTYMANRDDNGKNRTYIL